MKLVTKNIIANYLGKIWGFVSIFVFIRLYINLLGIESYAIINFYTVILGLLVFADGGLTATLTRELARDIAISQKSNLVHTFERLYLAVCLLIIVSIYFSAELIANNFLQSKTYSVSQVAHYIRLIGVGVGLQLFSTLYDGGLQGLQQQVLTNKIRILWSLFKAGIVLLPLYFYPNLEVFFWWQILCNVVLLVVFRHKLRMLLPNAKPLFSIALLKSSSKYAIGMMGIAFISAINIQIDKLVVSKYLTVELFGHYSIASTLAQLPVVAIGPIITAVFPLLSNAVSKQDIRSIQLNFHKYSFLITVLATPVVLCAGIYAEPLVNLWTGKPDIANSIEIVVRMLLIGALFLCFQMTPYYLALANGFTGINLYSGIAGLLIIVPMMVYTINHYGMFGATMPWVFVNVASFFVIGIYIVVKFLNNQLSNWLIWDILIPAAVTLTLGSMIYYLLEPINDTYLFILKSALITILSILVNILIYYRKFPAYSVLDITALRIKILGK